MILNISEKRQGAFITAGLFIIRINTVAIVQGLELLDYGAESPEDCEFKARLCHQIHRKLSLSTQR